VTGPKNKFSLKINSPYYRVQNTEIRDLMIKKNWEKQQYFHKYRSILDNESMSCAGFFSKKKRKEEEDVTFCLIKDDTFPPFLTNPALVQLTEKS
jgi:hypothetical protein